MAVNGSLSVTVGGYEYRILTGLSSDVDTLNADPTEYPLGSQFLATDTGIWYNLGIVLGVRLWRSLL